jgi:hypothetical protein
MSRRISQREARRLRQRVEELEIAEVRRRRGWSADYPGGVHIASVEYSADHRLLVAIGTARRLGHAVVVVERSGELLFYGIPHPNVEGL